MAEGAEHLAIQQQVMVVMVAIQEGVAAVVVQELVLIQVLVATVAMDMFVL
jgi:hypothetical protein